MEAALRAAEALKSFRVSYPPSLFKYFTFLHLNKRLSRVRSVSEPVAGVVRCDGGTS